MDKLPPLPSSDDEYWEGADVHKVELKEPKKCEHYFEQRTGLEVECKHCRAGFYIQPGWEAKEGHLYKHGLLVF